MLTARLKHLRGSMATQLEKLIFSIDLLDKVTGPAGKIKKVLGGVADDVGKQFDRMAAGAMGVGAAGATLYSLATPAHELNLAIGEVRSLDVAQSSLDSLSDSAIAFSVKYGESASEVIRSSYDIQSAIAGLEGDELAKFTTASAVLAKGTKSDAATITDYMGTMYGIFKNSADEMGKAQWVGQLTGQTATAVQMFKTTGTEMAGAFSSIGANATAAGIAQAEQIAILGSLQSTMSGSEAGTKYKAFLAGVGGAQEDLNLKFTDSQGNMLGMVEILEKLRGKFGDTLDVAEGDALKKAFGSDEAVSLIKQLMLDTGGLAESIDTIGQVEGMDKAEQMAGTMVDTFAQWSQGINTVKVGLGQALLPVLYPFVEKMAEGAGLIYNWTKAHPTLAKYIAITVLGVTALVAGVAAVGVVFGLASMAATGFGLAMAIATSPVTLTVAAIAALGLGVGLLVYKWDAIKASLGDNAWGRMLIFTLEKIGAIFSWLWELLSTGFVQFGEMIETAFLADMERVTGMIGKVGDAANWVAGKLGFGDDETTSRANNSEMLNQSRKKTFAPGGASQSVANAVNNTSNSKSQNTNIGTVVTSRPINSQEMNTMAFLAGA